MQAERVTPESRDGSTPGLRRPVGYYVSWPRGFSSHYTLDVGPDGYFLLEEVEPAFDEASEFRHRYAGRILASEQQLEFLGSGPPRGVARRLRVRAVRDWDILEISYPDEGAAIWLRFTRVQPSLEAVRPVPSDAPGR